MKGFIILPLVTVILPPISNEMEASNTLRPPPEPPEVTDASTLGGWVWVVLFGLVMTLSILANLVLVISVLQMKKKRQNLVYLLLILLFLVNLVDYGLLIFEFSLGLEHEYPHGQAPCALYQTVSKGNPIVQALVILLLVFYTANQYADQKSRDCGGAGPVHRLSTPALLGLFLSGLTVLYGLLALPTAAFAKIVIVEDKRYCEIEVGKGQKEISIYYLVYSAILSYWLPLLLSITPMIRLAKVANSDKYPEVTVVIATASSFFLFYSLHGCIVLVRHSLDAVGISLDTHHSWMIKVGQSLLWLVAYFWHVTRPLLAFLMDPELKIKSCCQPPYDLVETEGQKGQILNSKGQISIGGNRGGQRPLKVMLSPEITAESDENELTTLNNQENNSNFSSEDSEQILQQNTMHKSDVEEPEKKNLHSTLVAV